MKQVKDEKGITLIALIITVFVLLALIGLIDIIVPDDAFRKAEDTKSDIQLEVNKQQRIMNQINSFPDV